MTEGEASIDPSTGELCTTVHGGVVQVSATDSVGTSVRESLDAGGDALFHIAGKTDMGFDAGYVSDVYRSDDDGATWTVVGAFPAPRYNARALVVDDQIWVFGGRSSMLDWHDEIYRSDDGVSWELVGALPFASAAHSMTWVDGRWISVGGFDDDSVLDVVVTSRDGIAWASAAAFPVRIYGGPLTVLDDTLVYLGGVEGTTTLRSIYQSPDAASWTLAAETLPLECYFSAFALYRGDAYLAGGSGCETGVQVSTDRLASFSVAGDLPVPKSAGGLVVHHDALFYVGGSDSSEVLRGDGASWEVMGALPEAVAGGAVVSFSPR